MGWKWQYTRQIGECLYGLRPDSHRRSVRCTDIHKWIVELDKFDDNPAGSNEGILEAIQMVWYEEWQEDNDPEDDPYRYDR